MIDSFLVSVKLVNLCLEDNLERYEVLKRFFYIIHGRVIAKGFYRLRYSLQPVTLSRSPIVYILRITERRQPKSVIIKKI